MDHRDRALSPDELRERAQQASSALKIFPLPGVVVFPGTPTPFHIFEPRYRALVEDALAGDGMLAIATLIRPESAPEARSAVHAIACACHIEEYERHGDGRFDILVRGAARVLLEEEVEQGHSYREFRVEVLEEKIPAGGPGYLVGAAEALEQCVFELTSLLPPESGAAQLAEAATRQRSPAALADLVAAAVVNEPAARLEVLAERDVKRRLERVTSEVAGVILMLSRGRSPSA
jgi:Lon protease-like protein